jgi:hypothetical protein
MVKAVFPAEAVKAYMRSRGIDPLILNLYPFWGWAFKFS